MFPRAGQFWRWLVAQVKQQFRQIDGLKLFAFVLEFFQLFKGLAMELGTV